MKVTYKTIDAELKNYLPFLDKFLKVEMNQQLTGTQEIAETVLTTLIGSRNIRQGAAPMIEVQANIINLVKRCIAMKAPIPVLVGAGPKKTDNNASIDIAELSVLSILDCVNNEVRKYHEPGLDIKIRLEDLTGQYIEGASAVPSMFRYMGDFKTLTEVLEYKGINTFKESELANIAEYNAVADEVYPLFLQYLKRTDGKDEKEYGTVAEYGELTKMGWSGLIPHSMRTYLYSKYDKLMDITCHEDRQKATSRYLAATLARNITKATGHSGELFDANIPPMEIAFASPTPGIPETMQQARVYYRTVTMKNSKKHIPFWRARGVMKVNANGAVRYSLHGFGSSDEITQGHYVLKNGSKEVVVSAGTIIED